MYAFLATRCDLFATIQFSSIALGPSVRLVSADLLAFYRDSARCANDGFATQWQSPQAHCNAVRNGEIPAGTKVVQFAFERWNFARCKSS
jgi:hypothetical protein